ncbi:MAG TPA: GreA/GreB family elongation factor [Kofleriaceae bacterium]
MSDRDKARLRTELLGRLEAQLATARAAHAAAIEGATDEEARPENDKDTRGLEQSYLARGYAQRVAELEAAVASIAVMTIAKQSRVAIGAIVATADDRVFFIAGHGGGVELGDVTVVTPTSPLGRALLGKRIDDECEVAVGDTRRTLEITSVE